MALTDSLVDWAVWVKDNLADPQFMQLLGIAQVMYGDQDKIGPTPLVCVEPSEKRRAINGAPRRTSVTLELYVLIYHGRIQDVQLNRQEADELAEAIEKRLHLDPTCGSLAVHSLVSNLASGVANKGGALHRATRLTFTAESQVQLPMAGV